MPRFGAFTVPYLKVLSGAGHYVFLPVLTTAQRNALSPAAGWVIYNSTTGQLEQYDGSGWEDVSNAAIAVHAADITPHTFNFLQKLRTGQYYGSAFAYSDINIALTANQLYGVPFYVARAMMVDRIAVHVKTGDSGKVARLGIYRDGTNLYPGALVVDGGEISVASTGVVAATISAALTKGLHWLAVISNGVPTVVWDYGVHPVMGKLATEFASTSDQTHWRVGLTYAALPDPFTSGGSIQNALNSPLIALRVLSLD